MICLSDHFVNADSRRLSIKIDRSIITIITEWIMGVLFLAEDKETPNRF